MLTTCPHSLLQVDHKLSGTDMYHYSQEIDFLIASKLKHSLTSQPADCRHYSTYCSAGRLPCPASPSRYASLIVEARSVGDQPWTFLPDGGSSPRHRSSGLFGSAACLLLLACGGDLRASEDKLAIVGLDFRRILKMRVIV